MGDLRAEIQEAVASLKGEAQTFGPTTKDPMAAKLLMVAENLSDAEKAFFFFDGDWFINVYYANVMGT